MEKVDYEHGKFRILTTDIFGFDYEDYVEWCELNERQPQGEDSNDYWNWCRDEADSNFECDMANISATETYNTEVEISGQVGLWDGTHEIEPVICNNVKEAIMKCFGKCDDIDVDWNDGVLDVYAKHHDGTNRFTIQRTDGNRLPYLYAI